MTLHDGMSVCPHCGVIAPVDQRQCAWCQAELGESRPRAPARADDSMWVAVRCEFQCRSCGFFVPLDHLDIDGTVACLRCGVEQVFDVDSWRAGLAAAHDVGDRAAGGQEPPTVHRSLRVAAAPGCPVCDECSAPLTVTVAGRTARASCAGCGEHASYELPERASALYHNLLAALAPEHRVDAADATEDVSSGTGAFAVRCPNCAGPIPVDGVSHFHSCEFCHTPIRIRDRTMRRLITDPKPLPWWLLFRGPSEARIAREKKAAHADGKPRGAIERPAVQRRGARAAALQLGLPLALLAAVGAIGFSDRIHGWAARWDTEAIAHRLAESPVNRVEPVAEHPPPVAEPPPVAPVAPEPMPIQTAGCRCRAGTTTTAELVLEASPAGDVAARLELSDQMSIPLSAEAMASIPTGARVQLGIACTDTDVVIAWPDRVTSWSIARRANSWTVALASPPFGDSPSARPRRALSVRCRKLDVRKGRIKIPLGRTKLSLRTDTGQPG